MTQKCIVIRIVRAREPVPSALCLLFIAVYRNDPISRTISNISKDILGGSSYAGSPLVDAVDRYFPVLAIVDFI